jgi:hypothetical protein
MLEPSPINWVFRTFCFLEIKGTFNWIVEGKILMPNIQVDKWNFL